MLIQQLRREFRAAYYDSYLGLTWKLVLPIVPVSVYVALQYAGIFHSTDDMPRVLYIVIGFTFWSLLSTVLTNTLNRLEFQGGLLKKVNVPLPVIYFSGIGQILFDFLVRSAFLLCVLLYYHEHLKLNFLLLPVLALPFFMFSFGLGVLLSFFLVFFKDLRHFISLFISYGIYASGVIFPAPKEGPLKKIFENNPIYILMEDTRHLLLGKPIENLELLIVLFAISILVFLFALNRTYLFEERIVEYL